MKRFILLALSTILILCLCIPTSAHSGKTDAAGGHYDSSTGEYHYHHGYPAHQHENGDCPYGFKDMTDHSSNSGSHSNSSGEGWIVIIIIVIIGAVLAFCFWLCHDSGSSGSKTTTPPKTTSTAVVQSPTNAKNSRASELEAEVSRLKREKSDLESSIRYKDALIKQKDIEISNYQKTDAQKRISELEISLKTAQRFRDSHWSQLTALKKEHENYVKNAEAELKKAKDAATPVSVSEQNRLHDLVIKLQLDIQRLEKAAKESETMRAKEKEKYEREIARLNSTSQQPVPSQHQAELNGKIKSLEQINETHKNTITSLKKEIAELRKATHVSKPPAEEERRHYEEKIEKLKEELKEPTYFKNLFTSSLRKLEKDGDSLFYNYPSVHDFLRQVTDKRFHRAMIEDIAILDKIQIQASIRSSGSVYTTSLQNCSCVDYQRTHAPCKHMLYLAYHSGVLLIHQEETKKSMKTYLDKLQKAPVPKK